MLTVERTAELNQAVNEATRGMVDNLDRASQLVREAVARLLVSFQELRHMVEEERALLMELTEKVRASNGGSAFATTTIALVNDFVEQVVRVSHESMRMIERLQYTSDHVDSIVRYANKIDDLARETRFVALNARIETQRAGAAGSTFKVVADEVKRLASASAELSLRIRAEVSACHQRLGESRQTAESLAGHDMMTAIDSRSSIVEYIEKLDQVNTAMEGTLQVVSHGVNQAVRALQFEDMVTQLLADTTARIRKFASLFIDAACTTGDEAERLPDVCAQLRALGGAGTVTQSSLHEGSVELF